MTHPIHDLRWQRARRSKIPVIALALSLLAMLLAGCAVLERPIGQLDNAAAAAGQLYAGSEIGRVKQEFPLAPRPAGSPQAIAEDYLQRFQPGPEPRVFQNSLVYDRQGRLLADLFDEDELVTDDSVGDVWAALDALGKGDLGAAAEHRERIAARWAGPVAVGYSS